jgi:RNA polymerase sigma-70 factor (ECF subfamily)
LAEPSDKNLIQAVFGGDKAAYGNLYDRYARLVRAVCYDATHNITDAQDLAQDVFMRAYEKLDHLRNPDCFGKWLIGIARLRCREWQRTTRRDMAKRLGLENDEPAASNPSDNGSAAQLRRAITVLPSKERLALHTFYLRGKSAEHARKIMGLSRSGFYRVLDRARKRLEKSLLREREDIP